MLGAMTSLTGGGGLSASSSATATNGDFGADSSYKVGNMTFGAPASSNNNQLLIIGAVVVIGLFLWKKK